MKLLLHMALVAATCHTAWAQPAATRLEGKISAASITTPIHLKHLDGADISIPVDARGNFSQAVAIKAPGFYTLNEVGTVYLRPGDQLKVQMDTDSVYVFSGKGSEANNLYKKLFNNISTFLPYDKKEGFTQEVYLMDSPVFLQKLNAFEAAAAAKIAAVKDPFFREIATKDLHYYCNGQLYYYSLYYGVDLKKQEAFYAFLQRADRKDTSYNTQFNALYQAMYTKKLDSVSKKAIDKRLYDDCVNNDVVLFQNSASYRRALNDKITRLMYMPAYRKQMNAMRGREAQTLLQKQIADSIFTEPFIRSFYTYSYTTSLLKTVTDHALRDSLYQVFMAGNATAKQKKEVEKIYRNSIAYTDNNMAPGFTYTTVDGQQVDLGSLRGKYVYIDVWATWCGPCKAEIPHLTKVEDDYHGKNIHFVSLSVDQPGDKQKWIDYVKNNQLKGIQLMADKAFESDFIQKFNINAIPRFILIAPDGKIIAANARRPSDPELRKQLDALL